MAYSETLNRPYDSAIPNLEAGPIDLADVILDAQRALSLRLRVALPAKVLAVDGNQNVQVQTLIKARFRYQADLVDLPPIGAVPVLMPRGANYSIRLPVAVGDTGLVVFSDRSLDVWLADTQGGTTPVDPQETRCHDFNDAVFVPGLVPFAAQTTEQTTDLVITNGNAQVRLLQNGTVKLGSIAAGGQELLNLLDQLLQNQADILNTLQTQAFVLTQLGPQPFIASTLAALAQLQATATNIRTNLDTLKANS